MRIRSAWLTCLLFGLLGGCSTQPPPSPQVSWSNDLNQIQPTMPGPVGQLIVEAETDDNPSFPDESGYSYEHRPVYLYDEHGQLLQKLGGLDSLALSLGAGRYILASEAKEKTRQVQVVIQDAKTTKVRLDDWHQAPALD